MRTSQELLVTRPKTSMPTAASPRVSVVMPVYNGERYLRAAMDSILAQSFTDFEFIIVDDGSTDGTADILKEYDDARIKLITLEANCGIVAALNRGISVAQGEYIARMDCDDISYPERFQTQVQFLDRNPPIDIVGSWIEIIDGNSRPTGGIVKFASTAIAARWVTFKQVPVAHPAVMMRKTVFGLSELYSENDIYAQDYELWSRLNLRVWFGNIQRPLLQYRVHDTNISNTQRTQQIDAGLRHAQRIIGGYLERELPLEAIMLLCKPYRTRSVATLYSAIWIWHQLYLRFRRDHVLEAADVVFINTDFADTLILICQKNRFNPLVWPLHIYAYAIVFITRLVYGERLIQAKKARSAAT